MKMRSNLSLSHVELRLSVRLGRYEEDKLCIRETGTACAQEDSIFI